METTTERVNEIKEHIPAEPDTWVRRAGNGRAKWHRVNHFSVYVYAAWGGGWGAVVNAQKECGDFIHIEEGELKRGLPESNICPECATKVRA